MNLWSPIGHLKLLMVQSNEYWFLISTAAPVEPALGTCQVCQNFR